MTFEILGGMIRPKSRRGLIKLSRSPAPHSAASRYSTGNKAYLRRPRRDAVRAFLFGLARRGFPVGLSPLHVASSSSSAISCGYQERVDESYLDYKETRSTLARGYPLFVAASIPCCILWFPAIEDR